MIELLVARTLNNGIVGQSNPFFQIDRSGTGGISSAHYFDNQRGYPSFLKKRRVESSEIAHYPLLVAEIQDGFGRTMSRLPEVFGVSRQTLYNWKNGDTPKPEYRSRIIQLHKAARVFLREKFKPSSTDLDCTLLGGKSLIQLLGQAGDGEELASKLVRVSLRNQEINKKLNSLLGNQSAALNKNDFGMPHFNEDV
jgi:transcriptional regulator with XRE-family HTH domain